MKDIWPRICILTLALCCSGNADSDTRWYDQFRWAGEYLFRSQYLSESDLTDPGFWHTLGFEANGTFSSGQRDIATVNAQLSLWCLKNYTRRPPVFDGPSDCEWIPKNFFVDFHLRGDGKLNLRLGHPELPFGLEAPVSTNQTIRQLNTGRDLGLKLDWGLGANGTIGRWNYQTLLGRGSGIRYKNDADSYSFTGRIGNNFDYQGFLPAPGVGFSLFMAELRTGKDATSERWRVAVDGVTYHGPWGFMGQLSAGETNHRPTLNGLVEVNRLNRAGNWIGYLQWKSFNQETVAKWQRANSIILGVEGELTDILTLSAQVERELSTFAGPNQTVLDFQARFRIER